MKIVGEFLSAGLNFVEGDCVSDYLGGEGTFLDECDKNDCNEHLGFSLSFVTEFAWRENTGVKPEFNGLIDFTHKDGDEYFSQKVGSKFCNAWEFLGEGNQIIKWRPSLNQQSLAAESDTKESAIHKAWVALKGDFSNAKQYDENGSYLAVCIKDGFFIKEGGYCLTDNLVENTEHWEDVCTVQEFTSYCEKMAAEEKRIDIIGQNGNDGLHYDNTAQQVEALAINDKPIFTQAMADNGELPPVGSLVDVIGRNGVELFYGEGEINCEVLAHVENTAVIKMGYGLGCFSSNALKSSDTRTDREKAIDDAMLKIGCHPSQDFIAGAPFIIGKLFDAELLNTKVS